jgi:acetyltransferase-like isoleucine patch superfamily enzyme
VVPQPTEMLEALRRLYLEQQAEQQDRYQRSLPFADGIVDRWDRANSLGFGAGSSVYDSSLIIGDVRVGERTWIGPFTILDGSGGLEIGSTCSISAGVQIYTHDSIKWAVSGGIAPYEREPVRIGDHCYVGPMSIITKGVTIGRHCVVGANSIVNKDLPDYAIAFGSTCRIVGHVVVHANGNVEFAYDEAGRTTPTDGRTR